MPTEQSPKQAIVERIKNASNILVTVGRDPSVDELSGAIGLTMMLDKIDKITTAVFSGELPAAIDFLEPGKTFEENVDSLRDFIIALDKSKADRLRYKVEDDVVRVFITPYKTTISEKDLTFSQGDFNVDLVIALGVEKQEDIDAAIVAHGKILHDAVTVTINASATSNGFGEVNWNEAEASSLCEMLMSLSEALQPNLLDEPIATAILTGLVSATDRFRNERTSPKVMTMSAQLMAAGANQQLIAKNLEEASTVATGDLHEESTAVSKTEAPKPKDGEMRVEHDSNKDIKPMVETPPLTEKPADAASPQPGLEADAMSSNASPLIGHSKVSSWRDLPPPPLTGGTLNATTEQAQEDKQRSEKEDRNRVLLSHDGLLGAADTAASSATAMNSSSLPPAEPPRVDVFATPPNSSTIEPSPETTQDTDDFTLAKSGIRFDATPIPENSSPVAAANPVNPTLADLEAEVHKHAQSTQSPTDTSIDDARAAVDAALSSLQPATDNPAMSSPSAVPLNPPVAPSFETPMVTPASATPPPPPVPALPPLPDFSTLPPAPTTTAEPIPPVVTLPEFGADQSLVPAASSPSTQPLNPEPGQFQLPGSPQV